MNEQHIQVSAFRFSGEQLASLLNAVDRGVVSVGAGKDVLGEMFRSGKAAEQIIAEKGLAQVSDSSEIERVVDEILAKNTSEVERYRSGKKQVLGFFVGQVMKAMKGKGNPALVNQILKSKLGG